MDETIPKEIVRNTLEAIAQITSNDVQLSSRIIEDRMWLLTTIARMLNIKTDIE